MKYNKLPRILLALLMGHLVSSLSLHGGETDKDRIVVMISVDGLAGSYFDDPKAEMPNIRALAKEGARADSMKAVTPTVTWPNHTTLVTGATPARHGVVGNNFYDREKKERIALIQDPIFDKDQIVKIPTIYDAAKAAGLRTAGIRWPATRNAKTLDWTVPDMRAKGQQQYATASLIKECEESDISIAPDQSKPHESSDELYTKVFNFVLQKHRPQLALLHILNVDHTEHSKGPRSPEAYAAIKAADAQVGQVWEELKRDFPDKATLLVVSDHGFSPIKRTILPNVILRKSGLIGKDNRKNTGDLVQVVTQGGAAMIYILDESNRAAVAEQIRRTFGKTKGISKIIATEQLSHYGVADPANDPHAPDMILLAEEGCVFGDTAAGDLPFDDKPERLGSHGHDASLPDLHATFVAWGAGIKSGVKVGEIKNLDVAPTIAKLLEIPLPSADGKPLAKILIN